MGSVVNLEGKIYSCKHCRTHLALSEDIISKCVGSVFVGIVDDELVCHLWC
ncbi:hypothetical protein CK203_097286 [Vitis vinifera]|uniref:Yippee domain-containing protein n=1 Tax=Vitis vinifera TaxID=29760 RepID=A0A438D5C3_VITVI|nr:hypothetical protein CK203_097286 [Vitis vinifera]